ncbi:MAG TPA: antitoxin family protein [Gemmataceae bacterium]|nr:antitoxin family protein [Gemmataceae bacterium]
MSIVVDAVYENGVLKLSEPLPFNEHAPVRVTVEPAATGLAASSRRPTDLAQILAHAGAVDLGKPTGADNESIDADLAREYGSCHEAER